MNARRAVEAALYHMSRCKMPGFLAPIEFDIIEGPETIGINARVTSWPQHPPGAIVRIQTVSDDFLVKDSLDKIAPIETQTYERKTYATNFVLTKSQVVDKSLYEIADLCNQLMQRSVLDVCRGMMEDLWEC